MCVPEFSTPQPSLSHTIQCGTRALSAEDLKPGWTAPELIQGRGTLSSFSDIWSFGIVCLEVLLAGYTTQLDVAMRDLDRGKLPKRPKNVDLSDEMWKLMSRCWSQKPESRPTSKELKHRITELRQPTPATGAFVSIHVSDDDLMLNVILLVFLFRRYQCSE